MNSIIIGRNAVMASDRIAVIVSGNGLKDVVAAQEAVSPARKIAPDMAALENALGLEKA